MGILLLKIWFKDTITKKEIEESIIPIIGRYFVDISIYIYPKDKLNSELYKGYKLKKTWLEEQKAFELDDNYKLPKKLNATKAMVIDFHCDNIRFKITNINQFKQLIYDFYNHVIEEITKKFKDIFYHIYLNTELLLNEKVGKQTITNNVRIELPKISAIKQKGKINFN